MYDGTQDASKKLTSLELYIFRDSISNDQMELCNCHFYEIFQFCKKLAKLLCEF